MKTIDYCFKVLIALLQLHAWSEPQLLVALFSLLTLGIAFLTQ